MSREYNDVERIDAMSRLRQYVKDNPVFRTQVENFGDILPEIEIVHTLYGRVANVSFSAEVTDWHGRNDSRLGQLWKKAKIDKSSMICAIIFTFTFPYNSKKFTLFQTSIHPKITNALDNADDKEIARNMAAQLSRNQAYSARISQVIRQPVTNVQTRRQHTPEELHYAQDRRDEAVARAARRRAVEQQRVAGLRPAAEVQQDQEQRRREQRERWENGQRLRAEIQHNNIMSAEGFVCCMIFGCAILIARTVIGC